MNKRIIFSLLLLLGLPLHIVKAEAGREAHYGLYSSETQQSEGSYCTYQSCHAQSARPARNARSHSRNNGNEAGYTGSEHVFIFSPRAHRWYAYDGGRLLNSGTAAGGASYCRDIRRSCRTPSGVFHIISKGGPNCRSTRYPRPNGGAKMDYCMFFTSLYAIHGSQSVPAANVSHGCVRVTPASAQWLSNNFIHIGTKVIVRSY